MTTIHPTSIIDERAELGANVSVGPMCHVGAGVRLGDNVRLISHVSITGETEIGARTEIYPFSALGGEAQHLTYGCEKGRLIIGSDVTFREHTTMNRGTDEGGGVTNIGNRGFFMIGSHVAHDGQVGDDVIFANNAIVGGHVTVGNGAFLGGHTAVHQRCRIGDFAFIGGGAIVVNDVIPYASAVGNHARLAGLNVIGMKRRGMARETIHALRGAYQSLFASGDAFADRVESTRRDFGDHEEVVRILNFIDEDCARPLMGPTR